MEKRFFLHHIIFQPTSRFMLWFPWRVIIPSGRVKIEITADTYYRRQWQIRSLIKEGERQKDTFFRLKYSVSFTACMRQLSIFAKSLLLSYFFWFNFMDIDLAQCSKSYVQFLNPATDKEDNVWTFSSESIKLLSDQELFLKCKVSMQIFFQTSIYYCQETQREID